MNREEFKKYEGKRTIGRLYEHTLSCGRIVGYSFPNSPSCDFLPLLAIDDENGWAPPALHKAVIPNEKDRNDYLEGKHKYLWVRVSNVCMDKDFDLTEILKGCEGIELWSDICGKCKLDRVDPDGLIRVLVNEVSFIGLKLIPDGRFYDFEVAKCLLWPSETNRDWSTFVAPVKVRDDDWVACCESIEGGFVVCRYGKLITEWKYIIKYDEFRFDLTEEELEKLNINKHS